MENQRMFRKHHLEEAYNEAKENNQSFEDWYEKKCCKPHLVSKEEYLELIDDICKSDIIPEIKEIYNTDEGKEKLISMFGYFDGEMITKRM